MKIPHQPLLSVCGLIRSFFHCRKDIQSGHTQNLTVRPTIHTSCDTEKDVAAKMHSHGVRSVSHWWCRSVGYSQNWPTGTSVSDLLILNLEWFRWRGAATVRHLGLRSVGRGFKIQILLEATLRNNLRQVVYTYVPLSPSSITWYRPKGGDALRLRR